MYTMKEVCHKTSMTYETLKYYCNEGLIPNVKRDKHNYRVFDDKDIAWIQSLTCLKKCGMGMKEMKEYVALCLDGEHSIPKRQEILKNKKESLLIKLQEVQDCIAYIDGKQQFYTDVLEHRIPYMSNLIEVNKKA